MKIYQYCKIQYIPSKKYKIFIAIIFFDWYMKIYFVYIYIHTHAHTHTYIYIKILILKYISYLKTFNKKVYLMLDIYWNFNLEMHLMCCDI